jgi:hypothetical protein
MKEIFRYEPTITIEQPKFNKFKCSAASHRGIILSLLVKFNKDAEKGINYTALELKQVWSEALTKYNELKKSNDLVTLELLNWKGKDIPEIFDGFDNEFILVEHRKDKETGIVEESTHKVPHENVNRLLKFIRTWKIKESHDCYDFVEVLGKESWEEVWGERTDTYFPLYYYPIKVLEKLGIIKYSGRGKITRLK